MNVDRSEKIDLEKRRRHQVYTTLDYLISRISYFDFFSKDAFQITTNAKYFSQICKKKEVTSEYLLYSFLNDDNDILEILKEFKITKKRIARFITKSNKDLIKQKKGLPNLLAKFQINNQQNNVNINFSYEVNKIFEKASENALTRFKTPVINSNILFITLLEEKNVIANKMLRHLVKTDLDWYLLRYKILKELHTHESSIRNKVKLNQHYFAYLLKTQLTDKQFSTLINNDDLSESVGVFRNDLVNQTLAIELFELLNEEVNCSMRSQNIRKYTT